MVVFVSAASGFTALVPGMDAGAVQRSQDEVADELRRECRRGAEQWGIAVTFLARRGDAYGELCAAADEFQADMVVVGCLRAGRAPAGRLGRHPAGPRRPLAGRRGALITRRGMSEVPGRMRA